MNENKSRVKKPRKEGPPLFTYMDQRFHDPFRWKWHGFWIVNPELLSFDFMHNPNTGEGLKDEELEYLAERLLELVKRLDVERTKRGRSREVYIDTAELIFTAARKEGLSETDAWQRVWADERLRPYRTKKLKLRQAVKARLKREQP